MYRWPLLYRGMALPAEVDFFAVACTVLIIPPRVPRASAVQGPQMMPPYPLLVLLLLLPTTTCGRSSAGELFHSSVEAAEAQLRQAVTQARSSQPAKATAAVHATTNNTIAAELSTGAAISLPGAQISLTGLRLGDQPAPHLTTLSGFLARQEETMQLPPRNARTQNTQDGTGGQIWMSALLLQAYLTDVSKAQLVGRRCIEFGSGTGLVSIAAARLGAGFIAATDGNPVMVALSSLNARASLTPLQLQQFVTAEYMWGSVLPPPLESHTFSAVLLADLLYRHDGVASLLAAVDLACVQPPARCTVFVGYERRDYGQRGELLGHRDLAGRFKGVHTFFEELRTSLGFKVSHVAEPILSTLRRQLPTGAATGHARGSFVALATRGEGGAGDDGETVRAETRNRKHSEV
jgi:predicted nicotinamide N-methyase